MLQFKCDLFKITKSKPPIFSASKQTLKVIIKQTPITHNTGGLEVKETHVHVKNTQKPNLSSLSFSTLLKQQQAHKL